MKLVPKRHLALLTIAILKPMWAQAPPTQANGALQLSPDGTTVYDLANSINWLSNMNLAASNRFGVPLCDGSSAQKTCVNSSGLMNYASAGGGGGGGRGGRASGEPGERLTAGGCVCVCVCVCR